VYVDLRFRPICLLSIETEYLLLIATTQRESSQIRFPTIRWSPQKNDPAEPRKR